MTGVSDERGQIGALVRPGPVGRTQPWSLRRLKYVVRSISKAPTSHDLDAELHVALEDVVGWTGQFRCVKGPDRSIEYGKVFERGDILYSKLRPGLAKVAVAPERGVCVGEMLVLRPVAPDISADFVARFLRSGPVVELVAGATEGAKMPRIDWGYLGDLGCPLPGAAEQAAIAAFLSRIDGLVGTALEAKKKVIALLAEQKSVIIHRAVTRGLDPTVSLRPSGVQWLGEIPAHWAVRRGKYLVREMASKSTAGTEPLLSVSQYSGVTLRGDRAGSGEVDTRASSLIGYKLVERGDLVVNIMLAWNGSLGVSGLDGIVSPAYCVYRFRQNLDPRYFHHLLRSPGCRMRIKMASTGIVESRLRLYTDEFGRIEIPVPPLDEQAMISEFLDREVERIDRAVGCLLDECDRLAEYRTRLSADVLTGAIDLRAAQGPSRPAAG